MAESKLGKLKGLDRFPYMYHFIGKKRMLIYFPAAVICASSSLLTNIFSGQLYRVVTNFGDGLSTYLTGLVQVLLLLLGILAVVGAGRFFFLRCCAAADRNLRLQLVNALARMPLTKWNQRHSADWLTALGKDADNAASLYRDPGIQLLDHVVSVVGGFFIIIYICPSMFFFAAAVGLLSFGIGLSRAKSMHSSMTGIRASAKGASEQVSNQLAGAWAARFYPVRKWMDWKYRQRQEELFEQNNRVAIKKGRNSALGALGYTLSYSGALIFGLFLVYEGRLELSAMLALWPISMGVSLGLGDFGFVLTDIQSIITAVDRIKEIIALPKESGGDEREPVKESAAIRMQNISFTYEGGETKALSNINLTIQSGERIAFVGASGSGSGKTTLMKLLMRFYSPDEGEAYVFGREANTYTLPALREQFSYVPQMAHLILGSIKENLLLVRPNADDEALKKAAEQANAHSFLQKLGYDTDVGEGGSHLSGGQRQRIAIARAFLKDAPILIFDEITAALDGESEEAITGALRSMGREKTLLLITHRLSTALIADRIVVMDQGKIVETGTHRELLNLNGYYARLWNTENQNKPLQ